jgi:hypothetical protein
VLSVVAGTLGGGINKTVRKKKETLLFKMFRPIIWAHPDAHLD